MPLNSLIRYYASNTQDAMDMFAATISGAGWELIDHFTSPYTYVFKSAGENNEEKNFPVYVRMYQGTNVIYMYGYTDWDNVAHDAGSGIYFGQANNHIDTDDDDNFYIWCSANKDCISIVSTENGKDLCFFTRYTPFYEPCYGRLAASVNAGSTKTITLSAGDTEGFIVGETYKIFNISHRERPTVTSIIPSANQIVVDSLTYNYVAGDVIAFKPFRWVTFQWDFQDAFLFRWELDGTGNDTADNTYGNPIAYTAVDPDSSTGRYGLFPIYFYDDETTGLAGMPVTNCTFRRCYINSTNEHTISIGELSFGQGTVTSGGWSGFEDSSMSWETDVFADKCLIITGGTGSGQFRKVSGNTSTIITITENFITQPDATSTYTICEEGWLYFYFNNSTSFSGAIRVL
jgi:hypothetical protein